MKLKIPVAKLSKSELVLVNNSKPTKASKTKNISIPKPNKITK